MKKETFKERFLDKLETMHGKTLNEASDYDKYTSLASIARDAIIRNWVKTNTYYNDHEVKQVYYLSIEFLPGKFLGAYLLNLGIRDLCKEALKELDIDLEEIEEIEPDAGLGNGGLGRLAACFLDSLASLGLPGHGCGIRYKYGLFEQKIVDGYQVELPDKWLTEGNIWEIRKPDKAVLVKFYGKVNVEEVDGKLTFNHEEYEPVLAVPYDVPIPGYQNKTVNTLRLWSAKTADKDLDLSHYSRRDYLKAVEYKRSVEMISEILYPDDKNYQGKELRLKQQYFMVSAGLQSIIRRYKKNNDAIHNFDEKVAIHINDTHPALAIPEMMRILIDEEGMEWEGAWKITTNTISYTNHTVLPEALEKWPEDMIKSLLPRIYMIIQEINERFCHELWNRYPGDWGKINFMSIISDGSVKMVNLSVVGSYSVNGVAKIHTEILKKNVLHDFYNYYPYKFNNKTNGITHRRWLLKSNPYLTATINDTIGQGWINHPTDLIKLLRHTNDKGFREAIYKDKLKNKIELARIIQERYSLSLDVNAIFDVQIKRIHGYKRQLLNALYIMDLYNRIKDDPSLDIHPRVFIFGGKAAPGYYMAKQIIKLINTLAEVINNDKSIEDKIKVIYLDNYRVSLAERIFPAADVSEQISTASKEASGTGNMKFMMNGAVTLGTLDGANIEIKDEVGDDNIVVFGMNADEVLDLYRNGGYHSMDYYNNDARIKRIMDELVSGRLPTGHEEFRSIYESLLQYNDEYFVLKDFDSYVSAQTKIDQLYRDRDKWNKMCINNIAHSGKFSSDKTISEYAVGIWQIIPNAIEE